MIDTNKPSLKRIFTGLTLPDDLAHSLIDLPARGVQGRWNNWRDLHLTLRFIGDVPEHLIPEIQEKLTEIKRPPIHVEIGGLNYFDNPRQPILFADVLSTRKLETLVADITDKLAPICEKEGIKFNPRPYRPHITLARLKKTPKDNIEKYIKQHGNKIKGRFLAEEFHLIHSGKPDESGARYKPIQSYRLTPH